MQFNREVITVGDRGVRNTTINDEPAIVFMGIQRFASHTNTYRFTAFGPMATQLANIAAGDTLMVSGYDRHVIKPEDGKQYRNYVITAGALHDPTPDTYDTSIESETDDFVGGVL